MRRGFMKKNLKKRPFNLKAHNKWIRDQVITTINKELLLEKNTMHDYQSSIQSEITLLRDNQQQGIINNKIIYKTLNLVLLIPPSETITGPYEILLEEQLRYLVKNVYLVKYAHELANHLSQNEIDLILVINREDTLPFEIAKELRATNVKKAVWQTDQTGATTSHIIMAPLFDYVFTQLPSNISAYQLTRNAECHYLPFAVNTSKFYPKFVATCYKSDVLILGNADPFHATHTFAQSNLLSGKKLFVYGNGWEELNSTVFSIPSSDKLAEYYNGARIVINYGNILLQKFEVSACGTFQMVQQNTDKGFGIEWDDFITFSTLDELTRQFEYYWSNIDQRRLVASRAMADNKYNHSFLQRGIQLLDIVFN